MNYSDKEKIVKEEQKYIEKKLDDIYSEIIISRDLQKIEGKRQEIRNIVEEFHYTLFLKIGPDWEEVLIKMQIWFLKEKIKDKGKDKNNSLFIQLESLLKTVDLWLGQSNDIIAQLESKIH